MKRWLPLFLGISLLANAGMLYVLITEGGPPTNRAGQAATVAVGHSPAVGSVRADPDSADLYYTELLSKGFAVDETKPLVLARLRAQLGAPRTEMGRYWERNFTQDAFDRELARVTIEDSVRAKLIAIYGSHAASDPTLRSVFAPLDQRYAFLNSEQQLALQKYQIERQRARAAGPVERPVVSSAQSSAQDDARLRGTVDLESELAAILGTDGAKEYLYRFSPLAEQIRAANAVSSESEFRKAFDALLQLESIRDPQGYRNVRATLRTEFGAEGFTRLWAARDPFFSVIEKAGRENALNDDTTLSAYELFNDAQDQFADVAARYVGVDGTRAADELRPIRDQLERRLAGLVGDDVATKLLDAQAQFMLTIRERQTR